MFVLFSKLCDYVPQFDNESCLRKNIGNFWIN